jgi:hypothetical protein
MIRTVGTVTTGQKVFFCIYAIPVVLYSGASFIAGAAKPDAMVIVCSLLLSVTTLATWSPVIVRLAVDNGRWVVGVVEGERQQPAP